MRTSPRLSIRALTGAHPLTSATPVVELAPASRKAGAEIHSPFASFRRVVALAPACSRQGPESIRTKKTKIDSR